MLSFRQHAAIQTAKSFFTSSLTADNQDTADEPARGSAAGGGESLQNGGLLPGVSGGES